MGFKKGSDKKKKKSKKKSAADREWSHEGGQSISESNNSLTSNDKEKQGERRRRRTQERDERIRRGRNKIEIRKKKQEFIRKMSHKVSFNEILGMEEQDEQKTIEESKKRKVEPNPMKSASQVYKKFKTFFAHQNSPDEMSGSEVDDLEYGEDSEEDEDSGLESEQDLEADYVMSKAGIILLDNSHVDDTTEIIPPSGVAEWYFSSDELDSGSSNNPSTAIKIPSLELSSDLSVSISGKLNPNLSPFQVTTLGDIPNLHMMWAHLYRNRFASVIESTLLSYLSCYADLFIEGRNEHNDENIVYGALWHILGHVVNSRYSFHNFFCFFVAYLN